MGKGNGERGGRNCQEHDPGDESAACGANVGRHGPRQLIILCGLIAGCLRRIERKRHEKSLKSAELNREHERCVAPLRISYASRHVKSGVSIVSAVRRWQT